MILKLELETNLVILCYIFNYSFIDSIKQITVSNYNFDNNLNINIRKWSAFLSKFL